MASITTRETGTTGTGGVTRKNLPLTNAEIDTNFINLNTDKLEASYTGNANLVTLGTVTTGTWNATTIATTRGGTGLTSFTNGGAVYATSTSALTTGTLPATAGGTGVTSSGGNGNLLIGNSSNGWTVATLTGTSNRITVTNSSGGITLSTPQDIATGSNLQFNSLGIGTASSGTPGEIRATNQITSYYSDERLKENIELISNALDKVMSLRGVTYQPNSIAESLGYKKQNEVGVLAQDVERVLPEAVKPAPFDIMLFENIEVSRSGENYKTVQYEKLVPLLIEAIKELNKEVQQLKGK
jgi:trimeric autotransporter adhesin